MMKSWANLEYSAQGLTAYICGDDFATIKNQVKYDNPGIKTADHKIEVMSRLLCEQLNYGKFNEQEDEPDDLHEKNLEIRWSLCDKVALAWCNSEFCTLSKAQIYLDDLIKNM